MIRVGRTVCPAFVKAAETCVRRKGQCPKPEWGRKAALFMILEVQAVNWAYFFGEIPTAFVKAFKKLL